MKKKKPRIGLANDIEAARFADILAQEGIPCAVISNDSSVYTGIFQLQNGWGYAEVPEEFLRQAESLLAAYRESLTE
ncbi:hypothetical protein B4O97_04810 [Marispirochaeta aestuarii]|uniref:DUF2007 domain-containing protein n=1 Tax=Marispirochaeta aestuarii TaxID=1963862 RepID=A0A1Y1S1Z6_9SPIO|nr:hypothetical protein [Marispirochaeta aestuarii]ORC36949.1 hypothetical protein B4O97_04810 [Marispirochaeta aestuarii]